MEIIIFVVILVSILYIIYKYRKYSQRKQFIEVMQKTKQTIDTQQQKEENYSISYIKSHFKNMTGSTYDSLIEAINGTDIRVNDQMIGQIIAITYQAFLIAAITYEDTNKSAKFIDNLYKSMEIGDPGFRIIQARAAEVLALFQRQNEDGSALMESGYLFAKYSMYPGDKVLSLWASRRLAETIQNIRSTIVANYVT